MGPDELLSRAEALVPQGHGGVDDVLSVSAHHDESTAKAQVSSFIPGTIT